jgi:hypothetical protein
MRESKALTKDFGILGAAGEKVKSRQFLSRRSFSFIKIAFLLIGTRSITHLDSYKRQLDAQSQS